MPASRTPIILASGSAARKRLLMQAGIPFTVEISPVDEEALKQEVSALAIPEQALCLAHAKGQAVAEQHQEAVIIAADQICECEGRILTKPGTRDNAIRQLRDLRGKTHSQHSAVVVFLQGRVIWQKVESAALTMRQLTDEEIAAYLDKDHPFGACGAYHYEENGAALFSEVKGSDDVIMGLPLTGLLAFLREKGLFL